MREELDAHKVALWSGFALDSGIPEDEFEARLREVGERSRELAELTAPTGSAASPQTDSAAEGAAP
jgi:hypothetical protein